MATLSCKERRKVQLLLLQLQLLMHLRRSLFNFDLWCTCGGQFSFLNMCDALASVCQGVPHEEQMLFRFSSTILLWRLQLPKGTVPPLLQNTKDIPTSLKFFVTSLSQIIPRYKLCKFDEMIGKQTSYHWVQNYQHFVESREIFIKIGSKNDEIEINIANENLKSLLHIFEW